MGSQGIIGPAASQPRSCPTRTAALTCRFRDPAAGSTEIFYVAVSGTDGTDISATAVTNGIFHFDGLRADASASVYTAVIYFGGDSVIRAGSQGIIGPEGTAAKLWPNPRVV